MESEDFPNMSLTATFHPVMLYISLLRHYFDQCNRFFSSCLKERNNLFATLDHKCTMLQWITDASFSWQGHSNLFNKNCFAFNILGHIWRMCHSVILLLRKMRRFSCWLCVIIMFCSWLHVLSNIAIVQYTSKRNK